MKGFSPKVLLFKGTNPRRRWLSTKLCRYNPPTAYETIMPSTVELFILIAFLQGWR